jgi:hypothetical protein
MVMTSFQKQIPEVLNDLHASLVLYLGKKFNGKSGVDLVNLRSIEKSEILYKKVEKYKKFRWVENQNEGGVGFLECLKILNDSWRSIAKDLELDDRDWEPSHNYIKETKTIRNNVYGHGLTQHEIPEEELLRYFDTFYRFGLTIEMGGKDLDKIDKIRKELGQIIYLHKIPEKKSKSELINQLIPTIKPEYGKNENVITLQSKGFSIEVKTINDLSENKTVLSVPASVTYDLIQEYKIHSCPNEGKLYQYKPTKYIAFRNADGEMESIFSIEKILVIKDFKKAMKQHKNKVYEIIKSSIDKKKHPLETSELKRLKKYCNNEVFKGFLTFFPNNRFYILSEEVEHLPDKKLFKERKVMKTTGAGEKKEELVPIYYDLSGFKR